MAHFDNPQKDSFRDIVMGYVEEEGLDWAIRLMIAILKELLDIKIGYSE